MIRELGVSDPDRCVLYVDELSQEDIGAVLEANQKKFQRILYQIYTLQYNDDLYRRERKNGDGTVITAMKFSGSNNTRIYCKEFHRRDGKKVVLLEAVRKKTQKNDRQIIDRISAYGEYEYEFD